MTSYAIGRRAVLFVLAGGFPFAALSGQQAPSMAEAELAGKLVSLFDGNESAAVLGHYYLNGLEARPEPERLVGQILAHRGPANQIVDLERGALFNRLQSWIHQDFLSAQTVSLDGWVLSVTEARVFALIAVYRDKLA